MSTESRLSPEELLNAINREENQEKKGRLKIFLGMSAGVGKTYAMLEAAQMMHAKGVDVVVGIVDTHGRQETAELLTGLKIIPEKDIEYKGKLFKELDLDAILTLNPEIVLVDELAHSNIPGSRHAKRWQDVLEILEHGINVYTTLNVQHIESLNDMIRRIVEVSVRETVPDLVIEKAASIQLVDLTPDELIQRLKEGKVYFGEQSQIAPLHFFQKDKLTALREIALRYAAEKVDSDLRFSLPSEQMIDWKPRDKLLVAVSSSPSSQKIIRATRRLASNMKAPWFALHVNDGTELDEKDSNQLMQNLQLAQDLGAEVLTVSDSSVADAIQKMARKKGVTQIIIGRTPQKSFFGLFSKYSLLDKLATDNMDVDIHVIGQEPLVGKRLSGRYRKKMMVFPLKEQFNAYLKVTLCVLLLTGINWLLLPYLGYKVIGVIFLIGILGLSLYFKKGPIFFASLLFAFAWGLFIPPVGTLHIHSTEDIALLILYVLTAAATGILVDREREQKELIARSEASTQFFYDISQKISRANSLQQALIIFKQELKRVFEGNMDILTKQPDGTLSLDVPKEFLPDEHEKNAALWVFEHGKEAGWSTATLPSCQNLYIPLKGFQEIVGVLVYKPRTNRILSAEEKTFLFTVCRQLAIYIERTLSEEKIKQHDQLKQIGNIHKTILDRLSHEFEQPLLNAKNAIDEWKVRITKDTKTLPVKEANDIENSFGAFQKILSNISAMSQLCEGMVPVNKSPQDIQELINECLEAVKALKKDHKIEVILEENMPKVPFDFYLVHMLLYNMIVNSLEYTAPASLILIEAKTSDDFLLLSLTDEGPARKAIAPEITPPNMGFGIAIAKAIAEAHSGYVKSETTPKGGTKFSLFIPKGSE